MSFEAYKIAVKLSLVNNVSSGLVTLAGQFQALNKHIGSTTSQLSQLEQKMLAIKRMGLIGGAAAAAGGFGLSLFRGPLEEAKQFQTEITRFASLGFGDKVNREAEKFATGMNTFGTSARDNMMLVSDAMAVFKDLHHAELAAPIMAKMRFGNEAIFGEGGKSNESKFMDMLKVIEFRRGLSSPQEFETQANFVQKVIAGSRNRVDATQLLQALKTGGVALSGRSNEAFYLGSEPLIQEFGGSRYGTAAMSIYQNLVQARGTITAQQELYRLGLLDKSKVQFNSMGMLKKALPGAFKGSSILENEGELALLEKVLLPTFAKNGITGEENIIRELGMILGNRTASGLMSRIYQQRATLHMQSEANRSAMNIDELDAAGRKTLAGQEIELQAKWRDVLRELGVTILPIAIKGVQRLTSILKSAISFAREFPTLTKGLTLAFGVLAGIVATGGTLMLATAGFKALGLALTVGGGGAGIGAMLMGLAKVAGVLGVGVAAYQGATWLGADKLGEWIGGKLADWFVDDPMKPSANHVRPASKASSSQGGHVYLDGRKVGEVVSYHQGNAASKPFAGTTAFDFTMMPPPSPMGYSR